MANNESEINRILLPACGSIIGAWALPFTALAFEYYYRHEPTWVFNSDGLRAINPHYHWFNILLWIGPIIGCLGSTLLMGRRRIREVGILRLVISCSIGYIFTAYGAGIAQTATDLHPYLLCIATWLLTCAVIAILYIARGKKNR